MLQDVLSLHGSQFRRAACIVASPPCQEYSYRAMPWKRVRQLPPPSNALFEACFRIQHEASVAAGRHLPIVVENVRGAERWVGPAAWHFGSYHLWGDVPALMPFAADQKRPRRNFHAFENGLGSSPSFNGAAHETRGVKMHASGAAWFDSGFTRFPSTSSRRRAASAQVAKIPFPLAQHIAQVYKPAA